MKQSIKTIIAVSLLAVLSPSQVSKADDISKGVLKEALNYIGGISRSGEVKYRKSWIYTNKSTSNGELIFILNYDFVINEKNRTSFQMQTGIGDYLYWGSLTDSQANLDGLIVESQSDGQQGITNLSFDQLPDCPEDRIEEVLEKFIKVWLENEEAFNPIVEELTDRLARKHGVPMEDIMSKEQYFEERHNMLNVLIANLAIKYEEAMANNIPLKEFLVDISNETISNTKEVTYSISGNKEYDIVAMLNKGGRIPTAEEIELIFNDVEIKHSVKTFKETKSYKDGRDKLFGQWNYVDNNGLFNYATMITFDEDFAMIGKMIETRYMVNYEGPYSFDQENRTVYLNGKQYKLVSQNILVDEDGNKYRQDIKPKNRGEYEVDYFGFRAFDTDFVSTIRMPEFWGGPVSDNFYNKIQKETFDKVNVSYWTSSYEMKDGKVCPISWNIKTGSQVFFKTEEDNTPKRIRPIITVKDEQKFIIPKGTKIEVILNAFNEDNYSRKVAFCPLNDKAPEGTTGTKVGTMSKRIFSKCCAIAVKTKDKKTNEEYWCFKKLVTSDGNTYNISGEVRGLEDGYTAFPMVTLEEDITETVNLSECDLSFRLF